MEETILKRLPLIVDEPVRSKGCTQSMVQQEDPFAELEIPDMLQENLARHRKHLAHFVGSLRSAGISEAQIELSVSVMVDSYKQELIRSIKAMVR